MSEQKQSFPPQQQPKPGEESAMTPKPRSKDDSSPAAGKLKGKVALITGADSGIGRKAAPEKRRRHREHDKVAKVEQDTPMKRAGQPEEAAPASLYLAIDDASYVTGASPRSSSLPALCRR